MRQKPDSYKPEMNSPLIGGYDNRELIDTRATWSKNEYAHGIKTTNVINLLEQAGEEFPEKEVTGGWGEGEQIWYSDADEVDDWKRKWLTVPPL